MLIFLSCSNVIVTVFALFVCVRVTIASRKFVVGFSEATTDVPDTEKPPASAPLTADVYPTFSDIPVFVPFTILPSMRNLGM